MFCPKCGAMLRPTKKDGKVIMSCTCGYSSDTPTEMTEKIKHKEQPKIEVVEKQFEINAKVKTECPECSNREAFFWEVQTRAADEPPTKFFKCTKCGHIWKDYD